ncbi:MAG: amino acid adenylation domain-containing protein [Oscillospiraceae bacterium]|nr:amino acid adenylation domain-containing protein [Oscillospiraceae bacterium]
MINVLSYLEQTLEHMPDRNKVAFYGTGGEKLTFNELYGYARSCGSYLLAKGIKKQPVAVFMQKSPAMIAAFFGCVYAGCYYIPLDAEMPAFRIRLILEAVNPALIICDEATVGLVSEWGFSCPVANANDTFACSVDEAALSAVRDGAIDTDPLYVVFTSGSTGIPKGVVATHRSVIDYIENLSVVLGVTEDTVFGNQSPLYLDACLKEVYTTIKFGSCAYLIPQSLFMFPVKLIEYINENKINTICWVASALSLVAGLGALKSAVPKTLHTIAFGSEVFPVRHFNIWRELLPDTRFIHLYGPTEATGMSCFCEITRTYTEDESIPIGRPFQNTEIILLDDNDSLAKDGEPGEICIRGTCLSPGYFGDVEKTSKAFVQNPLSAFPDLIYRTGDLGRRGPDGELYYISRRDHQIKHMGHRIELAEIEYVANTCPDIGLACAVFDNASSKIVLYYVTGRQGDGSSVLSGNNKNSQHSKSKTEEPSPCLKAYLKANLPRYMLPQVVIELDEMPQTPGGKIDRVSLLGKYMDEKEKKNNERFT